LQAAAFKAKQFANCLKILVTLVHAKKFVDMIILVTVILIAGATAVNQFIVLGFYIEI
jgi:hypothetical protein